MRKSSNLRKRAASAKSTTTQNTVAGLVEGGQKNHDRGV